MQTKTNLKATCAAACGLLLFIVAGPAQLIDPYYKPLPALIPACATFSAASGNGHFNLTRGSAFTARASGNFIRITSVSAGVVYYSVAANSGCERFGTITTDVGTFTVKQAAALSAPSGLDVDVFRFLESETIGKSFNGERSWVSWNAVPCADVYQVIVSEWDPAINNWVNFGVWQVSGTGLDIWLPYSTLYLFKVQAGDQIANTCGTTTLWGGYSLVFYTTPFSNL